MSDCSLISSDTMNDYGLLLEWDQVHTTLCLFLQNFVDIKY